MSDLGESAAAKPSEAGPAMSVAFWARPLPWALARARIFRRRQLRTAQGWPVANPPPVIEPEDVEAPSGRFLGLPAAASPLRELVATRRARPARQNFLAPPRPAATRGGPPSLAVAGRLSSAAARRDIAPPGPRISVDRYGSPVPVALRDKPADVVTLSPPPPDPRRRRRHAREIIAIGVVATLLLSLVGAAAAGWLRLDMIGTDVRLVFEPAKPPPSGPPPADPARRAEYYLARARSGDRDAQLQLAVIYAKGEGVAQDYAAAAKWFRAAAEQGLARAQYDLAVLYERGRGVTTNTSEAVAWYRKAANQNFALAQFNLAVALTKGEGTRQDFFDAALWYRRAAAQGIIPAMVNLAILYEEGKGVDASPLDAYAWYWAAAERGNEPARRRADELFAALSTMDQTRAGMIAADVAALIAEPGKARRGTAAEAGSKAGASSGPQTPPVLVPGFGPGAPGTTSSPTGTGEPDAP